MTDSPTSLYTAWLDILPQAFRAMMPAAGMATAPAAAAVPPDGQAMPFPADQIGVALKTLDGLLTQIYQGYLPALAKGGITAPATLPGWAELAQSMQPWAAMLQGAATGASGAGNGTAQLQLGIERTFGGLAEAFGLGPMRELEQAWREMLVASATKQRAQVDYLALVVEAWNQGTRGLLQELQAMAARGEQVESLLALIRLWARSVDAPLHETMQGSRGLEVTAKVIRAASQHREQLQKTIGLASEALHVPTRKDLDDAFREIQELKRELRRMKRALPAATQKKLGRATEPDA